MPVRFTLNGRRVEVAAPPMTALALVLRDVLHLTGTKLGCSEGRCGSCSVSIDGRVVAACLYPLALVDGREVVTVEGLASAGGALHPLQRALLEAGGVQCGMCIPGILMALSTTLADQAAPTESDVRAALDGNVCRCTGYQQIVEAALAVARASVP